MEIRDMDGRPVVVTDLKAAIEQADEMRGYRSDNPSVTQHALRQQQYWEHMYEQLTTLRDKGKRKGKVRRS